MMESSSLSVVSDLDSSTASGVDAGHSPNAERRMRVERNDKERRNLSEVRRRADLRTRFTELSRIVHCPPGSGRHTIVGKAMEVIARLQGERNELKRLYQQLLQVAVSTAQSQTQAPTIEPNGASGSPLSTSPLVRPYESHHQRHQSTPNHHPLNSVSGFGHRDSNSSVPSQLSLGLTGLFQCRDSTISTASGYTSMASDCSSVTMRPLSSSSSPSLPPLPPSSALSYATSAPLPLLPLTIQQQLQQEMALNHGAAFDTVAEKFSACSALPIPACLCTLDGLTIVWQNNLMVEFIDSAESLSLYQFLAPQESHNLALRLLQQSLAFPCKDVSWIIEGHLKLVKGRRDGSPLVRVAHASLVHQYLYDERTDDMPNSYLFCIFTPAPSDTSAH